MLLKLLRQSEEQMMQRNRVDQPFAFVLTSVLLGPPLAALAIALPMLIADLDGTSVGLAILVLLWAIIGGYVQGTVPAFLSSMLVLLIQRLWRPLTIVEVAVVSTLTCMFSILVFGLYRSSAPTSLITTVAIAVPGGLSAAVLWFISVRNGWCHARPLPSSVQATR